MFGKEDNYSICLEISIFNHSTSPNAYVKNITCDIGFEVPIVIVYIKSNRLIKKDEEITIWYGNKYFGEKEEEIKLNEKPIDELLEKIVKEYICKYHI